MECKKIFLTVILLVFTGAPLFADQILFRDGTVKKGKIIKITSDTIEIDPRPEIDRPLEIIQRGNVARITYDDGITIDFGDRKPADLAIPTDERKADRDASAPGKTEPKEEKISYEFKKSYPVLGLIFPGTPAGANFLLGYYWRPVGFHISGGYWGKQAFGGQLNLLFNFYHSIYVMHSVSLIGGYTQTIIRNRHFYDLDKPGHFIYGGIAYNMNLRGFFLELGITGGRGTYKSPQLVIQLGYVHRFNRL